MSWKPEVIADNSGNWSGNGLRFGWVTNNPEAAKRLRAADNAYELAKIRAQGKTLGEKIEAYRVARLVREAEYETILAFYAGR